MGLRLTVLVNDRAPDGLVAEHGFAVWIEAGARRLLFDTGAGAALASNAAALDVSLGRAEAIILSHGHYDHTGGLPAARAAAPTARLFAHPAVLGERWSLRPPRARAIGVGAAARTALAAAPTTWVAAPIALEPALGLVAPIPRGTAFEDVGGPFYLDAEGVRPDPIEDDLALWVRSERGLVVVVGCCHAGLVNTLRAAQHASGERIIHAVIGGLHLLEASDERLELTLAELARLAPDLVVPCHCTGDRAVARLQAGLGSRVLPGLAGASYSFSFPEA